jgi:hypothetical protein
MLRHTILAVFVVLLASGCTNPPNANYNKDVPVTNSQAVVKTPSVFKDVPYTKWQEDWNVRSYYYLSDGRYYFEFFSKRRDAVLECTMTYYAKNITQNDPDGLSFPEAVNILKNKPRKVLTNNVAVKDVEQSTYMKANKVYVADDQINNVKGATFYLPKQSANNQTGVSVDFNAISGPTGRGYLCSMYDTDIQFAKINGKVDYTKKYQYQKGIRNTFYYNSASYDKVCSVIDEGVVIRRQVEIKAKGWSQGIPKEEGYVDALNCRNADRVN